MKRQFYVYIHYKPNGDPFYVGKGLLSRANNFMGRNPHYRNTVLKYGTDNISVEVFPCKTEKAALQREVELIAQLRAEGFNLTNKTDGGEGTSGYVFSTADHVKHSAALKIALANPITKSRMCEAAKGNKNGLGYKHTEDALLKLAVAAKGNQHGRDPSPEVSLRISEAQKLRWSNQGERARQSARIAKVMSDPMMRARTSIAVKLKMEDPVIRSKISKALKGKPWSAKRRAAQEVKRNTFI